MNGALGGGVDGGVGEDVDGGVDGGVNEGVDGCVDGTTPNPTTTALPILPSTSTSRSGNSPPRRLIGDFRLTGVFLKTGDLVESARVDWESPVFDREAPVFDREAPLLIVKRPCMIGKRPCFIGKCPCLIEERPCLIGRFNGPKPSP